MTTYILRRVFQAIPLLIGISFAAFVLLRLAPGGPMAVYAQNPSMTEAAMRRIERILGLDQPIHVQYLRWATGMATGHLGYSYRTGRPVGEIILERVPATVVLMAAAYLIAVTLGLVSGIVSATRRHSVFDYVATVGAMVGLSVPTFWFGLVVIIVFAAMLGWIPSGGIATLGAPFSLHDRLLHLIGPASVLGLWMTASWGRYTRSSVLEVIGQDYIRTAQAKGLRPRTMRRNWTSRAAGCRSPTGPGWASRSSRTGCARTSGPSVSEPRRKPSSRSASALAARRIRASNRAIGKQQATRIRQETPEGQ